MRFKPSLPLTIVLFLLAILFARLGLWQLERKTEKENLFTQFETAPSMELQDALAASIPFTRVRASGRLDPERHFLQDNRMLLGRPGVHVLTPFEFGGRAQILVNRGWLPMAADRRSLPAVKTSDAQRELRGRMVPLTRTGPRLGEADRLSRDDWPQLVTYLDHQPAAEALETPIAGWIILLDDDQADGFEGRQWQPAVMEPAVHGGYALQWFSLALAAIIIWLVLGFRKGNSGRTDPPVMTKHQGN